MKKLFIRILRYLIPVAYGAGVLLLALGMALPALNGPVLAAGVQQVSGAIYTTDSNCVMTNANVTYLSKEAVYLDGGPRHGGSDTLQDGEYYVQVTSPDGELLGTSVGSGDETPVIVTGGSFETCYQLWAILIRPGGGQGYEDTPNSGGEYKVWVSTDRSFANADTKTDNFKVMKEPPSTPTNTVVPPTHTPTSTSTNEPTATFTATSTSTREVPGDTPTPTSTATSTVEVPTATFTFTPTNTPNIPGDTPTPTSTSTVTSTVEVPTVTSTFTPTNTPNTPGDTPTPTSTSNTPGDTPTPTSTNTKPPVVVQSPTVTPTQKSPGEEPTNTPIPTQPQPPVSGTKALIPQTGANLNARSELVHNQSMLLVNLGMVLVGFGLVMHGLYLKLLHK